MGRSPLNTLHGGNHAGTVWIKKKRKKQFFSLITLSPARELSLFAHLSLVLVHADDVLRDVEVGGLVALVQYYEEEVEAAHDGCANLRWSKNPAKGEGTEMRERYGKRSRSA